MCLGMIAGSAAYYGILKNLPRKEALHGDWPVMGMWRAAIGRRRAGDGAYSLEPLC